ncbi:hypothetical protein DAMDJJ_09335 [Cupriavidus necator]
MNSDARRDEAPKRYCRLNPEDDVIARPALVVSKIMVEAQISDLTGFK